MSRAPIAVYVRRLFIIRVGNVGEQPDGSTKRSCAVLTAFGSFVFGVLLLQMDLFGYGEATKRFTEVLAFQLFAPAYTGGHPKGMTVLLVDDNGLDEMQTTWPLSYEEHAGLLRRLVDFRPAAIMVDILFLDDRRTKEGDRGFEALREIVAEPAIPSDGGPPVPVFLATTEELASNPVSDTFARDEEPAAGAGERWDEGVQYVVVASQDSVRQSLHYPLSSGAGAEGQDQGAAYEIYRFLCNSRDDFGCVDRKVRDENYGYPMYVYWSVEPPPLNVGQADRGIFCRTIPSYPMYFAERASERFAPYYQTCPPVDTILARDFFHSKYRNTKRAKDLFGAAFTDKVVFYGVSLEGLRDVVQTPNHGLTPGVYLHAMALDNLITLGRDYQRPSRKILFGTTTVTGLVQIGILAILAVISLGVSLRLKGFRFSFLEKNWPIFTLVLTVGMFVFSAIVGVLQLKVFHGVPINIIGLSLIAPLSPVMLRFLCSRKE